MRPFHRVDICTDGAEVVVGKTAGASAQIKAGTPTQASSAVLLTPYWQQQQQQMQ